MGRLANSISHEIKNSLEAVTNLLYLIAGCIIFAEGHKTSGRFCGVCATTKTVGKLTTIETQNYTFDQRRSLRRRTV